MFSVRLQRREGAASACDCRLAEAQLFRGVLQPQLSVAIVHHRQSTEYTLRPFTRVSNSVIVASKKLTETSLIVCCKEGLPLGCYWYCCIDPVLVRIYVSHVLGASNCLLLHLQGPGHGVLGASAPGGTSFMSIDE